MSVKRFFNTGAKGVLPKPSENVFVLVWPFLMAAMDEKMLLEMTGVSFLVPFVAVFDFVVGFGSVELQVGQSLVDFGQNFQLLAAVGSFPAPARRRLRHDRPTHQLVPELVPFGGGHRHLELSRLNKKQQQ